MPSNRIWTAETPEEIEHSLIDSAAILNRLGGLVTIAADRVQENGEYFTAGLIFRWESFVPAREQATSAAEVLDARPLQAVGAGEDGEPDVA